MIMIVGLLLSMMTGCNKSIENKEPATSTDQQSPNQNSDQTAGNDAPSDVTDVNSNTNVIKTKATFKEIFNNTIMSNPKAFIGKVVPQFEIGLTKEETEKILGKPDHITTEHHQWGDSKNWIYDNIKGYQLIIIFNPDDTIITFQLLKDLIGNGIVPKVQNIEMPNSIEPINYNELGFEGILIGNKIDQVLQKFGEPKTGFLTYDEMNGYSLGMEYQGVTIYISLEGDEPYIQQMDTNDLGIVNTYRKIHVGSTVDDIIESYGEPQTPEWKETGELIYATEDYWFAIKFKVENNKVVSISIYEAS